MPDFAAAGCARVAWLVPANPHLAQAAKKATTAWRPRPRATPANIPFLKLNGRISLRSLSAPTIGA
jgi:hypothetical protein